MSGQDNQESHPPQQTKDNRADYFKDIAGFAKEEINYVRSAYKWLISLVAIVAIVGISVGIYFTYKSSIDFKKEAREEIDRQIETLRDQVALRVDKQFRQENIQKMVEEKARERIDNIADKLIEKQIADKISPQMKSADEQIKKLKQRNEITQLGDKGIIEASRDSLEEIERISKQEESLDIMAAAKAEIYRIKSFWSHMSTVSGENLTKEGKTIKVSELTTNDIIDTLLSNKNQKVRIIIIKEMHNRKEKGVPEALLECIKTDRNLEVVREAVQAFDIVTGFKNPDVFAYEPPQNWWKEHSAEVNARLKDRKLKIY
jgi:hypothetical protein